MIPRVFRSSWFHHGFSIHPETHHLGGSAERADRRGGAFGADRGDVEVLIATRRGAGEGGS